MIYTKITNFDTEFTNSNTMQKLGPLKSHFKGNICCVIFRLDDRIDYESKNVKLIDYSCD